MGVTIREAVLSGVKRISESVRTGNVLARRWVMSIGLVTLAVFVKMVTFVCLQLI